MDKPIIQGLWIGSKLSRFEHNSIKSYIKQGYIYHLYTYDHVDNIPYGVIIKDGNEILDKKYIFYYENSIAPFSDLFRYKLLYEKGGIWTDCDIICVKPLPNNKKHEYIFVAERTILKGAFSSCIKTPPYTCKLKKVLNSFIKTPEKSELMKVMYEKSMKYREDYLYKKYLLQQNKKTKKNIGLTSYHWNGGSKLLEKTINKLGLDMFITEPEFAFPINWWDFKYAFMDIEYIHPSRGWKDGTHIKDILKKTSNTYLVVIHNGWIKNQGLDKNAVYPYNSLFEKLDRFIHKMVL